VADIFREVDEDLRHERFLKLWRRFRWWIGGAAVIIIGAAVAYVVITDAQESARLAESAEFAAALDSFSSGRTSQAVEQFLALAEETDSGYGALARLRAADALLGSGDSTGAVALYDQLAGDGDVPQHYRDLAALLAAERLVDSVPVDEINQRLAPLMTPDNLWQPLAAELSGIAAIKAGRIEAARDIFAALVADGTAPVGVQIRANELLTSLGGPRPASAAESVDEPAAAQSPEAAE
jgi:hypothetical protein